MSVCSGLFAHCPECGGEVPVEADDSSRSPFERRSPSLGKHVCSKEPNQEGLKRAREEAMRNMGFFSEADFEDWKKRWIKKRLCGAVL